MKQYMLSVHNDPTVWQLCGNSLDILEAISVRADHEGAAFAIGRLHAPDVRPAWCAPRRAGHLHRAFGRARRFGTPQDAAPAVGCPYLSDRVTHATEGQYLDGTPV